MRRGLWAAIAVVGVAACGAAKPAASRPLTVRDAWARAADSGTTGAIYFAATNTDTVPVSITSLTSPDAVAAELHETMQMNSMAHMAPRSAILLAPDSTLTMAPGGLHVMLIELRRALRVGDSIAVTITLLDGRTVPVTAKVRAP